MGKYLCTYFYKIDDGKEGKIFAGSEGNGKFLQVFFNFNNGIPGPQVKINETHSTRPRRYQEMYSLKILTFS